MPDVLPQKKNVKHFCSNAEQLAVALEILGCATNLGDILGLKTQYKIWTSD